MGPESQANQASTTTLGDGDQVALKAENASLHDRLLRSLADAENTRRRAAQSAEAARHAPLPMSCWRYYRYWTICNGRSPRRTIGRPSRPVASLSSRGYVLQKSCWWRRSSDLECARWKASARR